MLTTATNVAKKIYFERGVKEKLLHIVPYCYQVLAVALSAAAAATPLFGSISPLGIAAAAGVSYHYSLASAVGAILGYGLTKSTAEVVKYLIAIVAVSVLRFVLSKKEQTQFSVYLTPIVGAVSLLCIQLLYILNMRGGSQQYFLAFSETLLIMLFSVLFSGYFKQLSPVSDFFSHSAFTKASLCGTYIALAASLTIFRIGSFSIGLALIGFIVCACSYCYGEKLSAVVGVASIVAIAITASDMIFAGIGFAFAAVLVGIFAQGERLNAALIFFAASFFGIFISGNLAISVIYLIQVIVSCIIFLLIPKSWLNISYNTEGALTDGRAIASYISSRLYNLADVLACVGSTVNDVFRRKPRSFNSSEDIYDYIAESCCKKCSMCGSCWVTHYNSTVDYLQKSLDYISKNGSINIVQLSELMKNHCIKTGELTTAIHKAYSYSLHSRDSKVKSEMMRNTLNEQFSAISSVLTEVAGEVFREELIDKTKTQKVASLFKGVGISPLETAVVNDRTGKTKVSVKTSRVYLDEEQLSELTTEVSSCCNREFLPCICKHYDAITCFDFYEAAQFTVEFSASQKAGQGNVNGDVLKTFCDARGNAHAILCDGMGKGRAAAVDGTLAATLSAKLLDAGFSGNEVAKLINVALSLKSIDDSSATLDIITINLYSGFGRIFKAGAAPSYLLKEDRVVKVESSSLPVGILPNVVASQSSVALKTGDIILMLSDGINSGGDEWLKAVLKSNRNIPASELSSIILELAIKKVPKGQKVDDMTVIVIKLIPAKSVFTKG